MEKEICETCVYNKYNCMYMMGGNVKADYNKKILVDCDKYERDEGQDICYFIHPEKWEMWLGNQAPTVENTIITLEEIRRLANSWNKWICDLMEDVDMIDSKEKQEIIAKYFK